MRKINFRPYALNTYNNQCALCDKTLSFVLITSHIYSAYKYKGNAMNLPTCSKLMIIYMKMDLSL